MSAKEKLVSCVAVVGLICGTAAFAQAAKSSDSTVKQVGASAQRMAEKPLEDLNVKKGEIPPKLLAIMQKPYDLGALKTCGDFQNEVAVLTSYIGPDVDSVGVKKGETATETMLGTAEAVVGSLIPGTMLIRKVTGAEAAQKKAKAAVLAGQMRRAYIKGHARSRGCKI